MYLKKEKAFEGFVRKNLVIIHIFISELEGEGGGGRPKKI
jgi:hypothetical protein